MRELLKATMRTGSGTLLSLLLGIISIKIMAVILGPSGVGLYSLLRQVREFSGTFGTAGGQTAMTQGIASRNGELRESYVATTFWIFAAGALLTVLLLIVLAPWAAPLIFGGESGRVSLVRWLAFPVAVNIAFVYIGGILNGFRAIGWLALLQVFSALVGVILAYPASRLVEVGYAEAFAVMMGVSQSIGVGFGLWVARREGWLAPLARGLYFHRDSARHFSSIAGVAIVTGLATTGAMLAVRSLFSHYGGLVAAGIFDVAWTLSMVYVMLVLGSFGTYYLPTLSRMEDPTQRALLIKQVMRLATLLMVPLVVAVVTLKPLVIQILYSEEFIPALDIVRWMLIGDYFKVASWVFGMTVLAYADMRVFFWTQLLWSAGFLTLSVLALVGFDAPQGIGIGFLILYVAMLAYHLRYVHIRHGFRPTRAMTVPWLLGLALVIGASISTWSATQTNWTIALLWIAGAVGFSLLALTKSERAGIKDALRSRRVIGL